MQKLKVWWIPQVPVSPFFVKVDSVEEGTKILKILADYDLFQLKNNIKPDYCNAGGLIIFEEASGEWVDWFDEKTGEDDPFAYVETLKSKNYE